MPLAFADLWRRSKMTGHAACVRRANSAPNSRAVLPSAECYGLLEQLQLRLWMTGPPRYVSFSGVGDRRIENFPHLAAERVEGKGFLEEGDVRVERPTTRNRVPGVAGCVENPHLGMGL